MKNSILLSCGFMLVLSSHAFALGRKAPSAGPSDLGINDRILVMPVSLAAQAKSSRWMYEMIEGIDLHDTEKHLGDQYREIQVLPGTNATLAATVNALRSATSRADIRAIDLFTHLHGGDDGSLYFAEGGYSAVEIEKIFASVHSDAGLEYGKFRVMFSDACYGKARMQNFINAGFLVADGSTEADGNGIFAYPAFLKKWKKNATFRESIDHANSNIVGGIFDAIANLFTDYKIDSHKLVLGDNGIRIYSPVISGSFDEEVYLKRYPDVAAAVAAGAYSSGRVHYLQYGKMEGRRGDFNEVEYLIKYEDVAESVRAQAFTSGRAHYLAYGASEGRTDSSDHFASAVTLSESPSLSLSSTEQTEGSALIQGMQNE